jgi:hypothetical protein
MNELTTDLHDGVNEALQMAFHNCIQTNNQSKTAIPYIVGPPGGGKSACLDIACHNYDKVGFISIHFAFKPLEDISGLPYAEKIEINGVKMVGTRWSLPQLITIFFAHAKQVEYLIILIDDYHLCSKDHQNLGYELFTEHSIRGFHLPQNSAIVLAGNDSSLSNSVRLSSGIVGRVYIIYVETDYNYWKINYAIPNNVHGEIISFLNNDINRNKYFHEDEDFKPYASPRAWSNLSIAWNILDQSKYFKLHNLTQGHIGIEAAAAFMTHYKIYSTINCKKIFQTGNFKISNSAVDGYIFGTAIISHYMQNLKKKGNENNRAILIDIINTLCKNNKEIAIAIMKEFNISLETYYKKFNSEYAKIMTGLKIENREAIINAVIKIRNGD